MQTFTAKLRGWTWVGLLASTLGCGAKSGSGSGSGGRADGGPQFNFNRDGSAPFPGTGGTSAGGGGGLSGGAAQNGSSGSGNNGGLTGPLAAFCSGSGAPIPIPGVATPTCGGDLANKTFRFAICSCQSFAFGGTLATDSFDSQTKSMGMLGSVGVNGAIRSSAASNIGGSLWAAGKPPQGDAVSLSGIANISGDLRSGGPMQAQGTFNIGHDVYSEERVITTTTAKAGGALHVPTGTQVIGLMAAKGIVNEPVKVDPPCPCEKPLDIPGIVQLGVTTNDNATGGVASNQLASFNGPLEVALPCGRYYFDSIHGKDLKFKLGGRTAIYVAGEVVMSGEFGIELAPGAELDMFIGGRLAFGGAATFGSTAEPARIRVYVGGETVALAGGMKLGANIYAPNAEVGASGDLEMSGALFGKRMAFSGKLTVHYDEAVLKQQGCQPKDTPCTSCNDCAGTASACKAGMCTTCTTSADCCAPLSCLNGQCALYPPPE